MKVFILLAAVFFAQALHAQAPNPIQRSLACNALSLDRGAKAYKGEVSLPLTTDSEIATCKANPYCGAGSKDWAIEDSDQKKKPTFIFGRYEIRVSVLVDFSITNVQIVDTVKGIGASNYDTEIRVPEVGDANPTDKGHSYSTYIYQREKSLPSYIISCKVLKNVER